MNEEVKAVYHDVNDAFGLPQRYKGVEFYPLLVKDLEYIVLFETIFTYPKLAACSTKKLFLMSYFKFAVEQMRVGIDNIEKFFKYVTKNDNVSVDLVGKNSIAIESLDDINLVLRVGNIIFSEEDFDNIREIILEQNGTNIDYINQFDPELEEMLKWTQKEYPLTFNDQIFTLAALFKTNPKEIGEWTLYQLIDIFDRLVILKQYETYEPLIASGQVKMKSGKLQSYLYHKTKKDRYDSILMSQEEFEKIESELTGKNFIK